MARLDRITTWDMGELVRMARWSNETWKEEPDSPVTLLTDDQLVSMLGLLSSLDMERKERAEQARKYQIDESGFSSLCKRSSADEVAAYLRHHPGLLNCLSGQPLRDAVQFRNREVVDMLLRTKGILPDLTTA